MSENLDLVRSIFADWERGDWTSAAWADPNIEFAIADGPEPGLRVGLAAMAKSWRQWLRAWGDYRLEADEYVELDDERVLVLTRYSGRGKTSGVEIGGMWTESANLFTPRDGKVSTLLGYNDRARALADLGLGE